MFNSYICRFSFHTLCYICSRLQQWSGPVRKSWGVCARWTGPDSVVSAIQLNNSVRWGSTRAEGVIYYKKGRLQTNYGCVFVLFLALHLSLSPSLSFLVLYIFTPQWVHRIHTHMHTHTLLVWLSPPPSSSSFLSFPPSLFLLYCIFLLISFSHFISPSLSLSPPFSLLPLPLSWVMLQQLQQK